MNPALPKGAERLVVLMPPESDIETFCNLVYANDWPIDFAYRARSPDQAHQKLATWAQQGIRARIIDMRDLESEQDHD